MDKSDKLFAINQSLPGLECFLREVLGNEELSSEAETKRQEFLKRLEVISTPPTLPPRPPQLPPRLYLRNESGNGANDDANLLYNNDFTDDPVAFASRQRELSRNYTYSSRGYVGRRDLFGDDSPIYVPQLNLPSNTYGQRDSIKSSSSDELYERLSFSGETANPPGTPITIVPEEPIPPQDSSVVSNLGGRGGVGRGSGGKGKLTSGWFKKEVKIYDTIHLSDITDPVIQGYLRDVKSKQRRWCVLKDEKLYIFKTRDDPCSQIIDLPNCDIGVDDKKKISYSFSLRQTGAPLVQLAIEQGHDLSPWISAVMAAAVRRSYRPTSPVERSNPPDKPPGSPYGYMRINIPSLDNDTGSSSTYEVPIECFPEIFDKSCYHSTPIHTPTNTDEHYNPPLPPLPLHSDSSSESSSDDDDTESPVITRKTPSNKENRRSLIDEGTDSPSDQSSHGLGDSIVDSGVQGEKGLRKRSSTALSNVSIDSNESGSQMTEKPHFQSRKSSISNGPRTKRRRKQTTAESEAKFLQDPNAVHSGILFQKRPLGVWSKRYCKLSGDELKCYRHANDFKPSLTIKLHDYDITLIDSKESKKAYGFKVSHPTLESFCFATDSRVSVERWLELLSLASTGRQDIVAPYPPYFKTDSADELEKAKSQDSLIFSEDALESGDATDFATDRSVQLDDDTSSFAADELDEDLSSDTRDDNYHPRRNHRVKSPQRRSPRHSKGGARERVVKRKNEKKRANTSPDESSYSVVSSSPGQFISDSSGEGKPDSGDVSTRASSTDAKKDKPKGWAESLKLKQQRFTRGHSLSAIIAGNSPEPPKTRLNNMKKTSMQSYSHLLSLLDREGRFSGFLTEVKVSKYSRTQLRRWCIVKNGVLYLFNKQATAEEPAFKLNLAEMWVVDNTEDLKSKNAFELHDKDERTFTFQVSHKEDYEKWLEVLRAFTEITVGRPSPGQVEQQDKSKSKEECSVNTFTKRSSIRLKLSQKVNVIDIFKRSQTYDFENPTTGEVPMDEVKCINFTGGQLTEVCVTDDHYTWSRVRWCTIKNSEFLIYQNNDTDDPIKRIVLYNVRLEEACEPEKDIYKFKILQMNQCITLIANNKIDYERWIKQIQDAIMSFGKQDHVNFKCRFPSPPRVFGHRRARSESLQKFDGSTTSDISSAASSPEKRLSQLSFGSDFISTGSEGSTDTLMNGHLQESVPGVPRGVTKWCAVTSEYFFVYDQDDQLKPSKTMILQDWKVREEKSVSSLNLYGFSLQRGNERLIYGHKNKEVALQWLSVLQRYCQPHEDELSPLIGCSRPTKSLSDDNLKSHLPAQEKRFLRKTLSEGKASGRKLLRKISEDNLLHRYRRADLFKAPWRSSLEKDIVKANDSPNCEIERRFSCGSLFDNGGKFSGYLVELVTRPLCRSEVRRWCLLSDDGLYVYDQPRMESHRKLIPLKNLELVNESKFDENKFVLKLRSVESGDHVFKMANRNDFEKWVAALTVKMNVLKSHSQRKGTVIEDEQTSEQEQESSTRYTLAPPSVLSVSSSVASDISNDGDEAGVVRSFSNLSNESVFAKLRPHSDAQTAHSIEERSSSPETDMIKNFENMHVKEKENNSDDTLQSDNLINLGSLKLCWTTVEDTESDVVLHKELNPEPTYQNVRDIEPLYENVTLSTSTGSNTLTSMTVEQVDVNSSLATKQINLKSQEGKLKYRTFQQRILSDEEESMFMDMLPKRSSEYELGPLYENLQFLKKNGEGKERPLWSIRSSKDCEDVFILNNQNSLLSGEVANASYKDRFSIASDYSGIVGEALLEEVGSCSTSRSGTLSSQTSATDQPDTAFDKEFFSDILGLPVSSEEAAEISEFCAQCDQETDQKRTSNDGRRSSTLTNRQSDVFFDAISELNELDSKDETLERRSASLHSHGSSCDGHDTYFGPSSSDEESFTDCQSFSTPHSSPYHRRYSTGNIQENDQSFILHVNKSDACDKESNPDLHVPQSRGYRKETTSNNGVNIENDFPIYSNTSQRKPDSNDEKDNIDSPVLPHNSESHDLKESSYFSSNSCTDSTSNRLNYASLDFNDPDKQGTLHSTAFHESTCDSSAQSSNHHKRKENYSSLQFPGDQTAKESSQKDLDVDSRSRKDSGSVEILKSEDESIVYVGAVIANEEKAFYSAESSLDDMDNSFDSNAVVMRDKSSTVTPSVRQELTKSQTEFIKAVTDAFEGIGLTMEEDESVETKF